MLINQNVVQEGELVLTPQAAAGLTSMWTVVGVSVSLHREAWTDLD